MPLSDRFREKQTLKSAIFGIRDLNGCFTPGTSLSRRVYSAAATDPKRTLKKHRLQLGCCAELEYRKLHLPCMYAAKSESDHV